MAVESKSNNNRENVNYLLWNITLIMTLYFLSYPNEKVSKQVHLCNGIRLEGMTIHKLSCNKVKNTKPSIVIM